MSPRPQPILSPLTRAAIFLVATVHRGAEQVVLDLLADVPALQRTVGFRRPEDRLAVVAGIGSELWDRLYPGAPRPSELHPLRPVRGARHQAPSTPGDLLFHIRALNEDVCFELASKLMDRLREVVTVVDEVHGFTYFDMRDLLGFVDGTENPLGEEAAKAVVVGSAEPGFEGGSYVVVQKYLHDLSAWNALSTEGQELVIGRTKLDDVELPDDRKPADSHVAVNTLVDATGTQHQILRDNMAFGDLGRDEFGTYYIGYAATPSVTERMLVRMFVGEPPGNFDRILDFSTAVTGGLFFVPTIDWLEDGPPHPAPRSNPAPAHDDPSLRLGNLR